MSRLPNSAPPDSDSIDGLLGVLADDRRRDLLQYFAAREGDVATLEELVERVAEGDRAAAERDRLAIELHHAALPKLADAGLLEYDPRSRTVRYGGDLRVEQFVDRLAREDRPRSGDAR